MRPRKKDRHLPACVYQRHGAYYLVKRGKWTHLGADLGRALQEYARLQTHSSGMAELIEAALPHITRGKKPATVDQYTVAARKLQKILAEFAPEQVLPKHVAQMKRGLADTPNMANRCLSVLRLVFDYALEEQLVDSNPCAGIKRLPEKARERLIEQGEFQRIRDKAAPRLQTIMDICFLTGQRLMDVVKLHRSALKDEGIYFQQDKTDAKVLVRWTPELRVAVDSIPKTAVFLFSTRRGGPPSYMTIRDQWKRACKAAGISDTQMRDIRAMSATEAKRQGKNATVLLGHASEQMTRRYLRGRDATQADGPSFGQAKTASNADE